MQLKPTGTTIEIYPPKTPTRTPTPASKPTMTTTTTSITTEPDQMDPTPHLTSLQRDGYVIIRSLLPPDLLLALQATSKYLTSKAREGAWPYVRTVPKQYPPWPLFRPGEKHNIWGVQHLLHPDMSVRDVYAEVYFHDAVLDVVKELLGLGPTEDDALVMELFNMLVSPATTTPTSTPTNNKVKDKVNDDFELAWHRDDIRPDVSEEEERHLLAAHRTPTGAQLHTQYNIALFRDSSLIVVPGSHARVRTGVERDATATATTDASLQHSPLPSQQTVTLDPGDAVFYDSNILHRGVYAAVDPKSTQGRMTLHGSVGLAGHGGARARQVLQHGVGEWVGDDDDDGSGRAAFVAIEDPVKRERAEGMRRRLVMMGSGRGLGYSLEG